MHIFFLEQRIKDDVQYYLCQSLARQKNPRFLQEVKKIRGTEHEFLLGFYYRFQGRYKEAVERQQKATTSPRSERRARRELVQNYLLMEDFDRALDIAKDNFSRFPTNPYMVQGYFNCLIQQLKTEERRRELLQLIQKLAAIPGERAKEMAASARAFMACVYDNDERAAFEFIDDAIQAYPTNKHPILTKMEIAVRFLNKKALQACLGALRDEAHHRSAFYNAFKKAEAIHLALIGNVSKAIEIVQKEMPNYSDSARARLIGKLNTISAK